jgi:CRISPR/Cas system-associated exonuclease Cas4 (RecB family)
MLDIIQIVNKYYSDKRRHSPCNTNRASSLGHPCNRYLYYCRTAWEKQTLPEVSLQYIYEAGNVIEKACFRELENAGYTIKNQGRDFEYREFKITGHKDADIEIDGVDYPIEVKSMSPFIWEKINTLDDMKNHKKWYIRNYPAQLQIYMLLSNRDKGLFYLKNKVNFQPKVIWMDLDYSFADTLLKKAAAVNSAVDNKIEPERITDNTVCAECSFKHICMPDRDFGKGAEVIDNDELLDLLKKREMLKQHAEDYDEIDEQIKEMVKEKTDLICGEYFITGKFIEKASYKVPAEIKNKYVEKSKYWKTNITKLDLK